MSETWDNLVAISRELTDLGTAAKLLDWDKAVMMPPKGATARARAVATITGIAHERLTDPKVGETLDVLLDDDSLDDDQRASVRIFKREYDKATKVPQELVFALAEVSGLAYSAWTEARPASDFSILQPHLEKMVSLKKEQADALGWEVERYDALLDDFEPEMKTSEVVSLFEELTSGLKPLAEKILDAAGEPPEFLTAELDGENQKAFSDWLVVKLNFDLERGRLDQSPHPFTMPVGAGDVRQTTNVRKNDFRSAIFATIHETGHALYEQGLPEEWADLPIGSVPSLGMHESQSRLWENQVGRSRAFCEFMLPHLKELFEKELGSLDPGDFYRGVNHVRRSLIRIYADEVTYNLHVAMRFEIERKMFRDEVDVADLPEVWDEAMERYLGVRPPDAADGVLQDMHWSIGALGYFPTYSIGTLYAASLFKKANEDLGDLNEDFRAGDTSRLLGWLQEKVYSQGYRYSAKELQEKVTGRPLSAQPFLDYIDEKYSEVYGL
jgi:carboxypeptidase Taq